MTTLTFPLSRIEGHAQVVIEACDGEVVYAHFNAMEMRGFEYFVQGTPAEQIPVIVTRICGVCSTAHHIASVKALEDAYRITPPPLARQIRELLLLAQLIQNQATSLFVFTLPDRLGLTSLFEHAADEDTEEMRAEIASSALKVRKAGTDLISLAGGQFIHPIKAVVGGISSGISSEEAEKMVNQLEEALPLAMALFENYWEKSLKLHDQIGSWGDDSPAHYLAAVEPNQPSLDADRLRLIGPDGKVEAEFPPKEVQNYLSFMETDYSYAAMSSYQGKIIRANSLARINMTEKLGTPHADRYLVRFQEAFGHPAHAILLFDLARGIELIYSIERALQILREPLDWQDTDVPYTPQDGEGFGLVEAPRGPLIHHYEIENGLIQRAKFIIPTIHNVMAIEHALRVAAEKYISAQRVDMELERAVGRVVRAFDPCIACATH